MDRQTIYCHECDKQFEVDLDLSLDGNHVFKCPYCQHEHCRVVKDGKITDIRWDTRNGNTYNINTFITSGTSSIYDFQSMNSYINDLWRNVAGTNSNTVSSYYSLST